jgi:hypothetical protein
MINQSAELPIVAFSVKVYRALLIAYPTKFQQAYGLHMVQVFRDCCLQTIRQGGTNGMVRLWVVTILDLVQSVISEHAHKEIEMKMEMKPEDIRRAGWALIAGGAMFLVSLALLVMRVPSLGPVVFLLMVYISMPLLVFGLLGLRNRYGHKVGWFGRNILLIGAIFGPLTSLFMLMGNYLSGWMWLSGHAVLVACLALFGFVALYKRPLPRGNVVPLIAGIWYLFMFWFSSITRNALDWEGFSIGVNVVILFGVQGLALAALGYILKSDVPAETATAA